MQSQWTKGGPARLPPSNAESQEQVAHWAATRTARTCWQHAGPQEEPKFHCRCCQGCPHPQVLERQERKSWLPAQAGAGCWACRCLSASSAKQLRTTIDTAWTADYQLPQLGLRATNCHSLGCGLQTWDAWATTCKHWLKTEDYGLGHILIIIAWFHSNSSS